MYLCGAYDGVYGGNALLERIVTFDETICDGGIYFCESRRHLSNNSVKLQSCQAIKKFNQPNVQQTMSTSGHSCYLPGQSW